MSADKQVTILEVQSNLTEYIAEAAEARKTLDLLIAKQKELKKDTKASAEEIELANAAVRGARKEYNQATQTLDKMTAAQGANVTSYDGLYKKWQAGERQLKAMKNTIKQNADGTYELTEEYIAAAKAVAADKEALNSFSTAVNDGRNNVGLYGQAIEKAFGGLGGQLSSAVPGFDALKGGIESAKMGFVGLKGAIMATGIGALILLLMGLVKYFTETKNGAGAVAKATAFLGAAFDTLMKLAQPLGDWLVKIFTKPKEALNDLIEFIKNQVTVRLNGVVKVWKGVWESMVGDTAKGLKMISDGMSETVTGVEDFRGKVAKLGREMLIAAQAAAALAQAQMDLDQANVDASYSLARLQKLAENYRQISDDDTRSMVERQAAAKKEEQAIIAMNGLKVKLLRTAYELARRTAWEDKKAGKDTIESQQKQADAYAALLEAQTAYTSAVNDNGARARKIELDNMELSLDTIEKTFESFKAANLAMVGDDRKTVAERRIILEALHQTRNENAAKEIAIIEKVSKKQLDLADLVATKDAITLDKKIKGLNLNEKETIRLQDIVKNYMDTNTEFSDQQKALDEKALARKTAFTAKELEMVQAVTDKNRTALQERAAKEVELSAAAQANLANQTIKNADTLALRLQEIEAGKNQVLRDMALASATENAAIEEQRRDAKARADIQLMQLEEGQKNMLLFDAESQHLANLAALEQQANLTKQENALKVEAEITAAHKQHAEYRKKILGEQLRVTADVMGSMSEAVGKYTLAGKAFAITQAIISTYSSAVAAYDSAAKIPTVGWVLAPVAAGAAIMAGLKNVAAIKSASPSGGGASGGGGGGSVISASFTAASPRVAGSMAANSQAGLVGGAQASGIAAQQSGAATDTALRNNPPVLVIETFESKRDDYNKVKAGGNV